MLNLVELTDEYAIFEVWPTEQDRIPATHLLDMPGLKWAKQEDGKLSTCSSTRAPRPRLEVERAGTARNQTETPNSKRDGACSARRSRWFHARAHLSVYSWSLQRSYCARSWQHQRQRHPRSRRCQCVTTDRVCVCVQRDARAPGRTRLHDGYGYGSRQTGHDNALRNRPPTRGSGQGATAMLLSRTVNLTSHVMEIPNGPEVNFVIGRGGASINAIQTQTGTHVNIQRANEVPAGAPNRQVTISGTEEAIARCRSLIHQRVSEYALEMGGGLALTVSTVTNTEPPVVLDIPNGPEVNHLIGAKGASINALQAETGTHISIQRASDVLPGSATRSVTITGADETSRWRCAELVRGKVLEYSGGSCTADAAAATMGDGKKCSIIVSQSTSALSATPSTQLLAAPAVGMPTPSTNREVTVLHVPNGPEVNFLIGAKGASINAIQAETGAHISVQRASEVPLGSRTRTVTITGVDAQRARCAELVRQRVADYVLEYPDGDGQPSAKRRRAAPPQPVPPPLPPPPGYMAYASPPPVAFPPGYPAPHYLPPPSFSSLPYGQSPPGYSHPLTPAASGTLPGYSFPPESGPPLPYLGYPRGPPMPCDLSQFNPHAYPHPQQQAPAAATPQAYAQPFGALPLT